jgi:hypothetical protein
MDSAVEITSGKVLELMVNMKNIQFQSAQEYLVLFLHCLMKANKFVLVGLSESENFVENNEEVPSSWNQSQDAWSFRYKHADSPNTYIMKILKLGSQLLIHCMAKEDENTIWSMKLNSPQYVNTELKDYANLSPFDIMKNLNKLIDDFNDAISSKILKNYNFKRNITKEKESSSYPPIHNPDQDPLRRPNPFPSHDPLLIGGGSGDLYGVGGGFGYLPGRGPGSGNVIGPNHPMFHGGPFPRGGPYPPNHPSGARYDPFGPVGPDFGSNYPRPDHFRPPKFDDDMYG